MKQIMRRRSSKHNDDFRFYDGDLPKDEGPALGGLIGLGLAVFRRTATIYVADADLFTVKTHCSDNVGQEFSGTADKRKALFVLVRSRSFANEHKIRLKITCCVDDLFSAKGM